MLDGMMILYIAFRELALCSGDRLVQAACLLSETRTSLRQYCAKGWPHLQIYF